jgi:ABC-type bacteriocin/lantibiotic exporter with double-glycine peptidase domain
VYSLCWQLVLINLAASICVFIRGTIFNLMSEKVARSLRGDLYASIMNKDVEFFDSRKTGDLLSRLGSDIAVVQEGLTTNVSMLIRAVIFIIASLVIVFIISWELTLIMIASILPVMVFGVNYGNAMKKT